MSNRFHIIISLLILNVQTTLAQNPGDSTFQSSIVHEINITFTQPNFWDSLMYYKKFADSLGLSTQSMMGNVFIDGVLIDSIGVKLKGNSSFGYPGQKKSIKLEFNEYVSGKKYDGLKSLNLNNNTLDPSMMREKLALDFLNKKGLPAPRCTYARVSYNGQYVGLYKMIEQVDKTFLNTHFGNQDGNLFKGDPQGSLMWLGNNSASYYGSYELHTNETANDWSDLVNLIDNINNTPFSNFYDTLETNLNTNSFIRQWAARNLFGDLDAYFHAPHNYYLYHNTASNKFEWNTWDVSVSFGFYPFWSEDSTESSSILLSLSSLTTKMLDNLNYKTTYLNSICDYLDYFSNETLDAQIDSIGNIIRPHIYAEPDSNQMFPEIGFELGMDTLNIVTPMGDIPGLKRFIANRRAYVIAELNALGWVCPLASVDELLKEELRMEIFPNPFSSSTTIKLNKTIKNIELELYNLLGQKIKTITNISGQTITLNRENLPNGLYFIRLTQDNKVIASEKLIISY